MADILIRNIDPLTMKRLQRRAKRRARSLEADLSTTLTRLRSAAIRRVDFG
jgi:plasmid stability protein